MTDGIIKGTGNSRFLKAPANALGLYPTHESLMEALASGTFPIDLNGINPDGWNPVGDKLGKATLLTDALCTALGLATTATPTQAMDRLRTLTGEKTSIYFGNYMGTDTAGPSNPTNITFPIAPKLVCITNLYQIRDARFQFAFAYSNAATIVLTNALSTSYQEGIGFGNSMDQYRHLYGKKSSDGRTISSYLTTTNSTYGPVYGSHQFNASNTRYYYFALL